MGQGKKAIRIVLFLALSAFVSSCGTLENALTMGLYPGNGDSGGSSPATTTPAIEATATYSIATGGVESGRDELVIYDGSGTIKDFTGHSLTFQADNQNLELQVRDGFTSLTAGSGAKIIPHVTGITIVSYSIDGAEQTDKYKVIVPPQSLIQALMGEARGQIVTEAQIVDSHVSLKSESITGNAVGAVIRNRVLLLIAGQPLNLFEVDKTAWDANPPASHWDSVITATASGAYQFSPVDPASTSYPAYTAAATRVGLTDTADLTAYDQAVLTSAGIFTNDIADPTGGAFGFRTPSAEEFVCLGIALATQITIMPPDCGVSDADFPDLKPIQVLIHPLVTKIPDGRPSFVFVRSREWTEPAVTNIP